MTCNFLMMQFTNVSILAFLPNKILVWHYNGFREKLFPEVIYFLDDDYFNQKMPIILLSKDKIIIAINESIAKMYGCKALRMDACQYIINSNIVNLL